MTNLRKFIHPEGASNSSVKLDLKALLEVDTFDGKVHVEWEPDASVTPLGQLPFFIQFLTVGKRFDPWIDDCPLAYKSNNASSTQDILGSLFLSVLSGQQVKTLIAKQHSKGRWQPFKEGRETKEATLKLSTWAQVRRVVLVRRRLTKAQDLVIEHQ
jgi:hypothetical protein